MSFPGLVTTVVVIEATESKKFKQVSVLLQKQQQQKTESVHTVESRTSRVNEN